MRLRLTGSFQSHPADYIKEFMVFGHPPIDDGDLALGKSVAASSSDSRYPAKNAVDGYWGSIWRATDSGPHWLTVDLGKIQTIHACKTWYSSEGLVYKYKIETSTDNQQWSLFADRSDNVSPADPYYSDYAEASARYVCLTELGASQNDPIDIRDFKVFGANVPIPPAKPGLFDGIAGHWSLNEKSGETAADSSGSHNDAAVKGQAVWIQGGRLGRSLNLVHATVTSARGVGGAFTLSFWIKTTDTGASADSETIAHPAAGDWQLNLSNGILAFETGKAQVRAPDTIDDGDWHSCAVSRSSAGSVQIAIDRNPQITTDIPAKLSPVQSSIVLGSDRFTGTLHDVYLYSRCLDTQELAILQTQPTTLVGKWTFTENSGLKSRDIAGSTNDAVFTGLPTWSADGINGGSITFGDNQSYGEINCPISDNFTISLWLKTTQNVPAAPWFQGAWVLNGEMPGDTDDFGTSLSDGHFVFGTGEPDTSVTSKAITNDGKWHHCVATRERITGTLRIYIDGKLDATVAAGKALLTAPINLRLSNDGDNRYIGSLSDVELYNGVLTSDQIATLYRTAVRG